MSTLDKNDTHLQQYRTLFVQGHYSECMTNLLGIIPDEFSPLSFILEHNMAICKHFIQASTSNFSSLSRPTPTDTHSQPQLPGLGNTSCTPQTVQKASYQTERVLTQLLTKLQGLPPSSAILEIECAVVYNLSYLQLTKKTCYTTPEKSVITTQIINCLARVNSGAVITLVANSQQPSNIALIAQDILSKASTDGVAHGVVLVILVYCLFLFVTEEKHVTQIIDLLETLRTNLHNIKPPDDMYLFTMSLAGGPELGSDVDAISLVTLAALCYKWGRFDQCVRILSDHNSDGSAMPPTLTYIKGCALFKLDQLDECIACLSQFVDAAKSPRVFSGMAFTLTGCCLSKQGAPRSSLQYFQRALQLEYRDPHAMYYTATQYRHLGQEGAELEALQLLVRVLEDEAPTLHDAVVRLDVESVINSQVAPLARLTHAEALCVLADRYCELARFADAADTYLDLIALLMSGASLCVSRGAAVRMPSVAQIFHQAAHALSRCGRHKEAIVVCDQVIDSRPGTVRALSQSADTQHSSGLMSGSQQSEAVSQSRHAECGDMKALGWNRKRALSCSPEGPAVQGDSEEWWRELPGPVVALKYKADALSKLGDHEQALVCLESVSDILEKHASVDTAKQSEAPAMKRPRLAFDECAGKDALRAFTVHMYVARAAAEAHLGKVNCALHSTHSAITVNPGSVLATFWHCVLLMRADRRAEACRLWTRTRHLQPHHMDALHLDTLLHTKRAATRNSTASLTDLEVCEEPSEEQLILLDIACLQHLQQATLSKRKVFSK